MPHLLEPEHPREPSRSPFELRRNVPTRPRLGMEVPHVQHALRTVGLEIGDR
jgi:hypothetical protein